MANLLASGASWLAGMQKQNASISVTLRRRGYSDVTVSATPGNTLAEQVTGDGTSQRFASRDYLIHVTDYAFDGVASEPREGDRIIDSTFGDERIYEVRPFAGDPCARPSDQYRNRWRIHTKLIEKPTPTLSLNQLRAIIGLAPIPYSEDLSENDLRNNLGIVTNAA